MIMTITEHILLGLPSLVYEIDNVEIGGGS
jgi:hypothetical protein